MTDDLIVIHSMTELQKYLIDGVYKVPSNFRFGAGQYDIDYPIEPKIHWVEDEGQLQDSSITYVGEKPINLNIEYTCLFTNKDNKPNG